MYQPDSSIVRGYAEAAARVAQFELACARALDDSGFAPIHRRELKDRALALGERARRHFGAIRAAEASAEVVERADRVFLAEFGGSLDENFRFIDRRLGAGLIPEAGEGRAAGEADKAFRRLASEYAPPPETADSLGLVALRAAELEAQAARAAAEGERRLERDFLAVKLRDFLERVRLADARNPELLWKCRTALERRAASGGETVIAAEAPAPGVAAVFPGAEGALDVELLDRGLRLRMEFRPAAGGGSVGGFVESGGESAAFSLAPSTAPGASRRSFAEFLAAFDLKNLYDAWQATAARLAAAALPRQEGDAAARLSAALDDLL